MTPTRPLARPYLLQVEITSHCNLKCKMCPLTLEGTPSSLQPGHMQEVAWEQVRRLAQEVGRVNLTGYGEPLANPRFLTALCELDDLGVQTGFSTNGALVTPRTVAALAGLSHLIHVNVSIDSPDSALYHEIRGGRLDPALAGLRLLAAGLPLPKRVSASSIVLDANLDSLAAFPPLLAQIGVKEYLLQGLIDWNPDLRREHLVHGSRLPEHLERIRTACRVHGIRLELQPDTRLDLELREPDAALRLYHGRAEFSAGQTRQCCVPWDLPFINKDGQVFPCCYSDASALMGDLREQTFTEIWEGEQFRQFRADLLGGRSAPTVCRRCTAVPVGPHPLNLYAARILQRQSVLRGRTRLKLVVRNTGSVAWTRQTPLCIGTAEKRDRESAYYHPSWLSPTRVASFAEEVVPPGEIATFRFLAAPAVGVPAEVFQLVVEGTCWLPDTLFELRPRRNLFDEARLRLKGFVAGRRAGASRQAAVVPG
jgi:radical SAM protein with 4Fe4S-binding SPASM domain